MHASHARCYENMGIASSANRGRNTDSSNGCSGKGISDSCNENKKNKRNDRSIADSKRPYECIADIMTSSRDHAHRKYEVLMTLESMKYALDIYHVRHECCVTKAAELGRECQESQEGHVDQQGQESIQTSTPIYMSVMYEKVRTSEQCTPYAVTLDHAKYTGGWSSTSVMEIYITSSTHRRIYQPYANVVDLFEPHVVAFGYRLATYLDIPLMVTYASELRPLPPHDVEPFLDRHVQHWRTTYAEAGNPPTKSNWLSRLLPRERRDRFTLNVNPVYSIYSYPILCDNPDPYVTMYLNELNFSQSSTESEL